MLRTNIVRLLIDKAGGLVLRAMGDRVSALWNSADYLCRQAFISGEKIPSYSALCAIMKTSTDYKALPTHIGQEVLKKLSKSWGRRPPPHGLSCDGITIAGCLMPNPRVIAFSDLPLRS